MRRALLVLLLALVACAGPVPPGGVHAPDPGGPGPLPPLPEDSWRARPPRLLRIGLVLEQARVELELLGPTEVYAGSGPSLGRLPAGRLVAEPTATGLRLREGGRVVVESSEPLLRLSPRGGDGFHAKGNPYGGEMLLLRRSALVLSLVQRVDMEEYLRGVVPWEIGRPAEESLAAVEAQAVAARTYAYSHAARHRARGFDLVDTVDDQVYHGLRGTHALADRAIYNTAGLVAAWGDRLIRSYYSSTCGGHGSTLTDVWTREGAPYLQGRPDRDEQGRSWCRGSSQFRWVEVFSARELGESIRANLPAELDASLRPRDIGVLEGLEVVARDASGRVQRLRIRTDRGEFEVWGDRIRWVLRPVHSRFGILRSTMFELRETRGADGSLVGVRVYGGGFGHGVGLCQTGALARAAAGQGSTEILAHYYRGVRVLPVGELRP